MSSFHSAGSAAMNSVISSTHSASSSTTTSTPRSRSRSSAPRNVRFSPITTRGILYSRIAPVHMSHGDNVVTMVARAYTLAGSRPARSRQSVSPCRIALPSWTRRLRPTAITSPSTTRAAPIGMPPSARPARACCTARVSSA